MRRLGWLLLAGLVAPAAADGPWVVATLTSHHFVDGHYNQHNYGLGFEHPTSRERLALIAGAYDNSFNRVSAYVGVAWTPLTVGPLHAGVIGGAVSGYQAHAVLPAVIPVLQVEGRTLGANLFYAPRVRDSVAVLGLQAKLRF